MCSNRECFLLRLRFDDGILFIVFKINITFVLTDDKGASTDWTPSIRMCACQNNGSCISPEEDDELNTDSRIVYLGCACQRGYTGRLCDSDVDACESNGQPCYEGVECIDLPPSADTETGYECGPCPSGYTGDGAQCAGISLTRTSPRWRIESRKKLCAALMGK